MFNKSTIALLAVSTATVLSACGSSDTKVVEPKPAEVTVVQPAPAQPAPATTTKTEVKVEEKKE